jgi:hypothetical protein
LANCLAADLHTAAVFHLMITSEYGLRALAKHLKVKTKRTLEFSDWEAIISAIDTKLNAIKTKPRGIKKQNDLEFYRSLLTECNEFKDVWRNNIMHARRRYNEREATNVFARVRDFMQRLSTRVSESI